MTSFTMVFYLTALLLGLLHIHPGGARLLTEVPSGPLYRAVGHQLSIPCKVTGINDSASWIEFEFRMQRLGNNYSIISTRDPNHSVDIFSHRVRNTEITVERREPTEVVFTITNLKASDAGEYECVVVNQERSYDGVYSAKIKVNVIEDTLTVSSLDSTSVSIDEGDPLTLTCQASSNTVQRTHLSVTWYLHTDGEEHPHPIVSLDQDLTLSPGPRFKERFRAGAVRLDKAGEATYRLNISQLEPSDQGRLYCQAVEWIQAPDSYRNPISWKVSKTTPVKVKAKGNKRAASDSGPSSVVLSGLLTHLIAFLLAMVLC